VIGFPVDPLEGTMIEDLKSPPLPQRKITSPGENVCELCVETDIAVDAEEQDVADDFFEALPSALM
jgi:hypothetical protein